MDGSDWLFAMEFEMNSILEYHSQDLVEFPENTWALPCRWVFRLKQTSIQREYRVEFDKVFSLLVKMTTPRLLLNVVAVEDHELLQLDVKKVFLHGDMNEEIYMEQPQGFASSSPEHLVCRLCKSLYELKQAP